MEKINIPEKVNQIIGVLEENGYEAYAVGGCVRDIFLGREPADWDITTSASPLQVKALFKRTIDTGIQHGTVTVMLENEGFEVTTYRVDGIYEDCRHPSQVQFTKSLLEDLKRRDFTINAMAYNESKGLVDAFDGMGDLRRGMIRCVGNAEERFTEDALRMLRAVRFGAQLGFSLHEDTRRAIVSLHQNLSLVSAERIQAELVKLIVSPHPEQIKDVYKTGMTHVFLPEFDACMACGQNNPHHIYSVGEHTIHALMKTPADKILRLCILFHDFGKPLVKTTGEDGIDHFHGHQTVSSELARKVLKRLKFDNDTIRQVEKLVYYHDYHPALTPAGVRKALNRIGEDLFSMYLSVQQADILAQSPKTQGPKLAAVKEMRRLYEQILIEQDCVTLKQLRITGRDLMAAGIPAGPKLGEILHTLLEKVILEPAYNQKEWLLVEAVKIYKKAE